MKKRFFVVFLLIVGLVFTGYVFAQPKKDKSKDELSGTALWERLKKENYSKYWKKWPGTTELYPGPEPHGAFLTTYVNEPAYKAIAGKKGKFPEGALIVQDNFDKNKKLKTVDVMFKVKGYNPQDGDWFWVQYKPDGRVMSEGKIDECIKCHAAQKTNDYVFTSKLK